jgi:hypothetical protein
MEADMDLDVFEEVGDYEPPDVEPMGRAGEITFANKGAKIDPGVFGSS